MMTSIREFLLLASRRERIEPPSSPRRAGVHRRASRLFSAAAGLLVLGVFVGSSWAANAPSQAPLLSVIAGAKPNLMFMIDKSGSMAFEAPDNYSMNDSCKGETANEVCAVARACPVGWISNEPRYPAPNADRYPPTPYNNGYICRPDRWSDWQWWSGEMISVPDSSSATKSGWFRMRAVQVNSQYYDPRITYSARINSNGTTQNNEYTFIDNQKSVWITGGGGTITSNAAYMPSYEEFTTTAAGASKAFTYVNCTNAACTTRTVVTLNPGTTGTVNLPSAHRRTDCGAGTATTCSASAELQNVLNWYKWYRNRTMAVSTALGLAMTPYENKFRVGYGSYSGAGSATINRGVRYFRDDTGAQNWKSQFYTWLYSLSPGGGTATHEGINAVAKYYARNDYTDKGNPWRNDPTSTSAEAAGTDLSCRRAYTIVLSDGAWNSGTSTGADSQYAGTASTNYSGTPAGTPAAFKYDPAGATGWNSANSVVKQRARASYVPYTDGGVSSNGLADLTARYFWHTDFSSTLANNIPQVPGQHNPTFWQNMTTYTIGWGLTPSGELGTAGGLTWAQINQYTTDWLAGNTPTRPNWADNLTSVNLNTNTDQRRVNDFIRAGFTGGGRAYSVYSGDDVKRAIESALGGMTGSGNDAGVAVSGNTGEFSSLRDQIKYTTEYKTGTNTGDIKAFNLNDNGGYLDVTNGQPNAVWSATDKMPAINQRKIFALSSYDADAPSKSDTLRKLIGYSTKLSDLPTDFVSLLNANSLQKTDESFVRWMLGASGMANVNGLPYRTVESPIGASVNSAPVFVGGRFDMGYADFGSVDGKDTYGAYLTKKKALPGTIFSANNDGKVHVFNGAKTDTEVKIGGNNVAAGTEFASFMPKGAMASQIALADENFRFRYLLDGPLEEHDIYDKNGDTPAAVQNRWRQIIYGSGGRAGAFIYGLESPQNTADRVPTKDHFLWQADATTTGYSDLAYITKRPTAGQLDDGTWATLIPSGHYAGAGKKVGLYVVNALTGKRISFIELPSAYNNTASSMVNRGLGGVVAVRNIDRKMVAAYAGDANGNLWRFDVRSGKMVVSYNKPLFTSPRIAADVVDQPIYAAPAWKVHPGNGTTCTFTDKGNCGNIVVIGTGILLDDDDLAVNPTTKRAKRQALYGVWDPTPVGGDDVADFNTASVNDLVEQTINTASKQAGTGATAAGKDFYKLSSNQVNWKTKKGWFLNLGVVTVDGAMLDGERVLDDLTNLGSSVLITSVLPEAQNLSIESCTASGTPPNNIYLLDALSGGNKKSFDTNSDGRPDAFSMVSIPGGGYTGSNVTSTDVQGRPAEGSVKLEPETKCTDAKGYQTGAGGSNPLFDGCDGTWRRTWRPVVAPSY